MSSPRKAVSKKIKVGDVARDRVVCMQWCRLETADTLENALSFGTTDGGLHIWRAALKDGTVSLVKQSKDVAKYQERSLLT